MIEQYRTHGTLEGRCMCGDVSITLNGSYVAAVGVCHCGMCQRWTGVAFGCFSASPEAVSVTGPVTRHASSSFAERAFCATCGSHLWMRNTQPEDDYEFMPGLFEGAAKFPLISEIYQDHAPAYVPLSGDHKRATGAEYESKNLFVEGDKP